MAVKPISPSEVVGEKKKVIPDKVIKAFNETIAKNYSGGRSTFAQEEVVKLIVKKGISRAEIFGNDWLDVEDLYRSKGWSVSYDKPGFNESYPATFTFEVKPKKPKLFLD